jgi:hypothetical protein
MGSKISNQAIIDVNTTNKIKGLTKVVAITDMKLTVKARSDKRPLPPHLIGLRKFVMTIVSMGHDYEALINYLIKKAGLDCVHPVPQGQTKLFEADSTYSVPCPKSKNLVMRQHKEDETRKYIRGFLTAYLPPTFEMHYINANNVEVFPTAKEKSDYFPLEYENESNKQAELWLEGNAQVRVRDWKADNVLYVQNGKTVWNNLSPEVMALFDLTYVDVGDDI